MHVLFHRYTPWQSPIRCSTNIIAQQFINHHHEVTYMYAMVHPGRINQKEKMDSLKRRMIKEKGACVFTPFTLIPFTKDGVFSKPWAADATYKYCYPSIPNMMEKGYGKPDVIWTVPTGSSALKKSFPSAKLIMQVVDYYPAFLGDKIKKIERRDYERADHIFIIGHTLEDYIVNELKIDKSKITVLGQGVNSDLFNKEYIIPDEIKDCPRPRAIWVGLLDKADKEMFFKTAEIMQEVGGSFILIGPVVNWIDELKNKFTCIRYLGPKSPDETPAYLKHCDLGIMLYNRQKNIILKGQNPLKLYEYAAAKLAIISSPHDEYNYLKPPVITVNDVNDLTVGLKKLIENKNSFSQLSASFSKNYSWQNIYNKIIDTIANI